METIDIPAVGRRLLAVMAVLVVLAFCLTAAAQQPPFRAGEVVVAAAPEELPADVVVIKYLPYSGLSVVAVETGREWGQIQRFREKGRRAGLNLIATASVAPDDPLYSPYQWHFPAVQAEQAWALSDGQGVVVAVLDTGLATGGFDGIGCVALGTDIANGDNDPFDGDGHGTHVSGTIAQRTGNGTGTAGLAYAACVLPVKVLGDNGSGSFADIAEGITWAVDHGAQVINMSLGVDARYALTNDPVMDPALEYAYANGVTVVCAAGNDAWRKNVSYPAIYPTTIAVGATDYANSVTRYSNKGDGLDLVAPGGDTSQDLNGDGYVDGVLQETVIGGSWGYYFFQGTSMATPHVAAAAALLIAHGTATTPDEVYEALMSTALDVDKPGVDTNSGYGLLQAHSALTFGTAVVDADGDGWTVTEGDCDDTDAAVNPGAVEVCDGIDNNCDGTVDEGCDSGTGTDADGDGWTVEDGDCNDNDPEVHPGRKEVGKWARDGIDNDCNGIIDG